MSGYEYKTLALPRLLKGPRARRQSAADFVSGMIEEVLNREDEQGWEYLGVQDFSTPDRVGLFGRIEARSFAVLVFRRRREAVEPVRRMMEMRGSGAPEPAAPALAPASPPVPAASVVFSEPPAAQPNAQPFPPRGSAAARASAAAAAAALPAPASPPPPPPSAPAAVPAPPTAAPFPPRAPASGYGQGARARPAPVDPAAVPVPPAPPTAPGAPRIDDDFDKI